MAAQVELTKKYGIFRFEYRIVNNNYTRERVCPEIVQEFDSLAEMSEVWHEDYDDANFEMQGFGEAYLDDQGVTREMSYDDTALCDFPLTH